MRPAPITKLHVPHLEVEMGIENAPRGTIVVYHADYAVDLAIRVLSGSYWSHVAVARGDGSAICAWAGSGGMRRGVIGDFADFAPWPALYRRLEPKGVDVENLIATLTAQIGKPYDYLGLIADPIENVFHIKMGGGPPKAFHCSGLVSWALAQQGFHWMKPLRAITPDDIFHRFT